MPSLLQAKDMSFCDSYGFFYHEPLRNIPGMFMHAHMSQNDIISLSESKI